MGKINLLGKELVINDGIEIYEYKSGFIHAKMFISDDEIATIGTFNLDFRSLYLNFEDGIYLYKSETINEMKKDFLNTINKSITTYITTEQHERFVFEYLIAERKWL